MRLLSIVAIVLILYYPTEAPKPIREAQEQVMS